MAVRVGVIGVGIHGMHHVRLLSQMEDAELVGFYDSNAVESDNRANDYNTRSYSSIDEIIADVDCVTVAVPTSAHYEVVMACFSKGKHVLVEKPIASSVEEADKMIAEADKQGLILAVGHIERYNPAYRALAGIDTKPVFVESHRLAVFNPRGTDVAVVLDLMIHDIDIVLDMVRRPIISVNAVGVSVVTNEADIANARLEFEGGCVANLTASRISQKQMRKCRTFQKNAYISMDFLSGESEIFSLSNTARPSALPGTVPQLMEGISYKKIPNDGLNALELELHDFICSVREGAQPKVTGRDGRNALEIASRVMESIDASMRRIE